MNSLEIFPSIQEAAMYVANEFKSFNSERVIESAQDSFVEFSKSVKVSYRNLKGIQVNRQIFDLDSFLEEADISSIITMFDGNTFVLKKHIVDPYTMKNILEIGNVITFENLSVYKRNSYYYFEGQVRYEEAKIDIELVSYDSMIRFKSMIYDLFKKC